MSVCPADEYKTLRAEMAARHDAAIAVFAGAMALPVIVLGFARVGRAIDHGLTCAALLLAIAASALVIRALFQRINRIRAYTAVFHESEQPAWETADREYRGPGDTLRQPRTMAWCLAAMGLVVVLNGLGHSLSGRAALVSLALILASALAAAIAAILLWFSGRQIASPKAIAEWQRVRSSLAPAPPTPLPVPAQPAPVDTIALPQPTPIGPAGETASAAPSRASAPQPEAAPVRHRVFWPAFGVVVSLAVIGAACTWLLLDPNGPRTDAVATLLGMIAGWAFIACIGLILYRKQVNLASARERNQLQAAAEDALRRRITAARATALALSDLVAANSASLDQKLEGQEAIDPTRFAIAGLSDRFSALGDLLQEPQISFAGSHLEAAFRTLEELYFHDRSSGLLTAEQWWAQFFQSAMGRRAFALSVSGALSAFATELSPEAPEADLAQRSATLREALSAATAAHVRSPGVRGM